MKMISKSFAILVAAVLLFSCQSEKSNNSDNTKKPNILFVFIDDMGYGDLACYGNTEVETPNIDQLAEEGLKFTQFYVNAPICSPSRVAVTTGQYPTRWEITSYIANSTRNENRGMRDYLDLDAPSLARILNEAGYYTAHIGKWHMGGGRDISDVPFITEYGFDESVTQFEGLGERYLATYETLDLPEGDSTRGLEKMSAALGKGEIHWIKRYDFTEVFVDRTFDAIERAREKGKPFYINLWPDDVHTPIEPPPHLRGDGSLDDKYLGVIYEMDRQIGRLVEYIKNEPELSDNTIIVFASDNGPARNVGSAGNLRGHKGNLYEGGIREPFIVWAPSIMSSEMKGKVNSETVISGMDLVPSLLEIAGANSNKDHNFDGINMSESLLGFEQEERETPLMWQRPPGVKGSNSGAKFPDLAIRKGDFKLLMNIDGSNMELYNIAQNKEETNNIVSEYPVKAEELKNMLLEWYSSMPPMVELE